MSEVQHRLTVASHHLCSFQNYLEFHLFVTEEGRPISRDIKVKEFLTRLYRGNVESFVSFMKQEEQKFVVEKDDSHKGLEISLIYKEDHFILQFKEEGGFLSKGKIVDSFYITNESRRLILVDLNRHLSGIFGITVI